MFTQLALTGIVLGLKTLRVEMVYYKKRKWQQQRTTVHHSEAHCFQHKRRGINQAQQMLSLFPRTVAFPVITFVVSWHAH